jgi:outer membrane lipoprotein carrier protein
MAARIIVSLFMILLASKAGAADVTSVTDSVQKKYQALSSFKADFTQVLFNAASKDKDVRTGRIVFSQPALIRWETEKPEKELLVVGKDVVWNAFPEEKSAYRYSVEDMLGSKTMLRFLSGKGNLKEDFHIQEEPGAPEGQVELKLVPREAEAGMVLAHAWVDVKTSMLARISIEDFYGNINDLTLSNLNLNPSVSKDQFQYTPPKDYSIFDNTGTQTKPR